MTLGAVLVFAFGAIAQDGVKWEKGTLQEALKKAAENQTASPAGPDLVFLDCYTSWCGPCKMMSESVFPQKAAGDYFNSKFVNIKIDMERGEGPSISKKYGVRAYPTFLILSPDGKEVGRVVGAGKLEQFIQKVETAVKPANQPQVMLDKFRKTGDINDAYKYLKAMEDLHKDQEIADFVVENYKKIEVKDFYTSRFFRYVLQAVSLSNTTVLENIIADKKYFDAYFGKAKVDKDLAEAINKQLYLYIVDQKDIPSQNIARGCELFHLLANNPSLLDEMVIRVSKALAAKQYDAIAQMIDGRFIGYSYTPNQMKKIKNMLLSIQHISNESKAKFLQDYKAFMESQIKGIEGDLEQYRTTSAL